MSRRCVSGSPRGKAPRIMIGAAIAAAWLAMAPVTAQDVALKDLMPKGMVIGVAINQRQSDGADTAGRRHHHEAVQPDQPGEPAQVPVRASRRRIATRSTRRTATCSSASIARCRSSATTSCGTSRRRPGSSRAPDGKPADRETLLARMRDHIHTVVGRYKGKIHGWDVVNEAIDDDGSLRKAPWRDGIGDDYVAKAFEFAHEADPDAELYYNDYNLEKPAKRAGVIRLVKDLQARGLRIDGIGNQGHWRLETPTIGEIEHGARPSCTRTGLKVMYTELDINLLPPAGRGRRRRPPPNPYVNGLPDEQAAAAREALRRHLRRLREASRLGYARDVLGPERRRLVAQSRPRELSAALGSPAPAEAGVPGGRGCAEARVFAGAARRAPSGDRAAARLHAVSRERHLRRRRDRRLDGDAGPAAADLRLQVDDPPQQRGGAQGRASSICPAARPRSRSSATSPEMIYVAVEAYADLTPASAAPAADGAALRRRQHGTQQRALRGRRRGGARRRSACRRLVPPTSTPSGTASSPRRRSVPINPVLTPVETDVPGVEMSMFELDALGSKAHGYVAKPAGEGQFPAVIQLQYAGVYALNARAVARRAAEGWLMINVDSHDKLPSDPSGNVPAVLSGGRQHRPRDVVLPEHVSARLARARLPADAARLGRQDDRADGRQHGRPAEFRARRPAARQDQRGARLRAGRRGLATAICTDARPAIPTGRRTIPR